MIIVTHNRPKDVLETLNSVLNQSVKPFEIILIDDGSSTPLNVKIDVKNLKLVRFRKEVGLSNARNYGIKTARGEYVAFIDDDAIADIRWLEEIQKGIRLKADILGGPLKPLYKADPPKWWNERDFGHYAGVGNTPARFRDYIWGANMIINKRVFMKVGFFRSDVGRQKNKLLSREDADLINRAKRMGCYVLFMPNAIVFHKVTSKRMTFKYILNWEYYMGKTYKVLYGYRPLKTFFSILINMFAMFVHIVFSKKSAKILRIARIVFLFGQLT